MEFEDGSRIRMEVLSLHELGLIQVLDGPESTTFAVQMPVLVREITE